MPTRDEIHYFGAGPAGLPTESVTRAAEAFINYDQTGLGLAEISHRSATANNILAEAKSQLVELLSIPNTHEIIFAHGGGSGAFASVVYNLVGHWAEKERTRLVSLQPNKTDVQIRSEVAELARTRLRVDYLITGSWSLKASQEAADLLSTIAPKAVNVVTDSRTQSSTRSFGEIAPESTWKLTPDLGDEGPQSAFVYYCDNETVDGVEFPSMPAVLHNARCPVVADMSSNILTRAVDISKYAVIFAGAQKNIGVTDTTILIVDKAILDVQTPKSFILPTPAIMHWPTLAKHGSLYNTIPIFSLFIAGDVMKQLAIRHGPMATGSQARISKEKADRIYRILDANPDVYRVCATKESRSRMNICFRISDGNEAVEKRFISEAEKWKLLGLKGHRSVGGIRISNYNSVTVAGIDKLEAFMLDFTRRLKDC